jgi:DnaJ domain
MAPEPTLYEVLGVPASASAEEIKRAYRRTAFDLHPDRHAAAPEAERQRLTEQMSRASEAYEVLGDPERRRRYDEHLRLGRQGPFERAEPRGPTLRPPGPTECDLCGASPAKPLTLRQGVGLLVARRRSVLTLTLCKGCGKAFFREVQNQTLLKGWWGVFAFLANCFYVAANVATLGRIFWMEEPRARTVPMDVPLSSPMSPGRPLVRRAGLWVSAMALVIAAMVLGHHGSALPADVGGTQPVPTIAVGTCVTSSGNQITGLVDCSQHHDARIVAIGSSTDACPATTTNYFVERSSDPQPGQTVCLDDTQ